jgi:hypothetical protein
MRITVKMPHGASVGQRTDSSAEVRENETARTVRLASIVHAQSIRVPGDECISIQIDGIDSEGKAVRIILEPPVVKAMLQPGPDSDLDLNPLVVEKTSRPR